MKDIKSYIIGFLFATSMFLFMGHSSPDTNIAKYQGFGYNDFEYMINIRNGKVYTKGWYLQNGNTKFAN